MRTFSEFQIIGHVGKVRSVGPTLRVDIAADYGRKDDAGQFQSNPYWNEVTLFNDRVIAWARDTLKPGDLVHARGTIRQTRWDKDGQTVYGVTLAAEDLDLLAAKAQAPA